MRTKILVIERENSFRLSLVRQLKLERCVVFSATKIHEVRKLVRRKALDVILLCLMELKKEGLHLLEMIKKQDPLAEVIVLHDAEQIGLSIEAMKLGASDDFLVPVDMNLLMNSIREVAKKKREQQENRKTWSHRLENAVMAISFAEAGEHETAMRYLKDHKKKQN